MKHIQTTFRMNLCDLKMLFLFLTSISSLVFPFVILSFFLSFTINMHFLCVGSWKDLLWPDNWTAVTEDGKRSAQFEHTLLVTENGIEVLTARTENSPSLGFDARVGIHNKLPKQ